MGDLRSFLSDASARMGFHPQQLCLLSSSIAAGPSGQPDQKLRFHFRRTLPRSSSAKNQINMNWRLMVKELQNSEHGWFIIPCLRNQQVSSRRKLFGIQLVFRVRALCVGFSCWITAQLEIVYSLGALQSIQSVCSITPPLKVRPSLLWFLFLLGVLAIGCR